jgi:hypothetical protein
MESLVEREGELKINNQLMIRDPIGVDSAEFLFGFR